MAVPRNAYSDTVSTAFAYTGAGRPVVLLHAAARSARPVIAAVTATSRRGGRGDFGAGVLEFGAGLALVSVLNADALLVVLVQPSTNVGALLYDLRRHRSAIAGLL